MSQLVPSSTPPAPGKPAESSRQALPLQSMLRQLRVREQHPVSMFLAGSTSALEALWQNRLRSLLTTLGIFIGVAAVIAALTLTQSAGAYVTSVIAGLGSNTVFVQPGSLRDRGAVEKNSAQTLTVQDAQLIAKQSHVTAVSPIVNTGAQVIYRGQNWRTRINGVSASFQTIQNWDLSEGFWFSDADNTAAQPVAVLGATVAQNLFGGAGIDPIGQKIVMGGQIFRVVGVLALKGGFNQDDIIFIPFNTALNRLGFKGVRGINQIQFEVDSADHVDVTVQAVTSALTQSHHIRSGQPADFQITTEAQLLQQSQQEIQILTILLVGVAAISLTVGGIGIMNIMLVSVTQRKREIGIRMSVGARRSDIRNQFLIEALLLCLVGGGLGLLGGLLVGAGVTSSIGIQPVFTVMTFVLPFVVSAAIGVGFGLYPAVKAARLDPVVALQRGTT
jgi:putative ABC transport system permease protein